MRGLSRSADVWHERGSCPCGANGACPPLRRRRLIHPARSRNRSADPLTSNPAASAGPPAKPRRAHGDQHQSQGSAADLIKLAMINIHRRLPLRAPRQQNAAANPRRASLRSPARRAGTQWSALVRQEMSGVMQLTVPLKVDVKTGATGPTASRGLEHRDPLGVRRWTNQFRMRATIRRA